MSVLFRILVVFLALTRPRAVTALEAIWIGNDENAPLPQSAKYRANLRKMCGIMSSGGRLPKSFAEKKHVLEKMCDKLRKDDENVASASKISTFKRAALVFGGIAGLAYVFHAHGSAIVSYVRRFLKGHKSAIINVARTRGGFIDEDVATSAGKDVAELMRLARLQRFDTSLTNAEKVM